MSTTCRKAVKSTDFGMVPDIRSILRKDVGEENALGPISWLVALELSPPIRPNYNQAMQEAHSPKEDVRQGKLAQQAAHQLGELVQFFSGVIAMCSGSAET